MSTCHRDNSWYADAVPSRTKTRPAATQRPPRRLSVAARRRQLVAAAIPVLTEQGFADFSLEEIAARADVTRNLLYHYFPRGRADIVLAVLEHAGHELTDGWILDDAIPLTERIAANNARMIAQAMEPTPAWTLYRMARGSADQDIAATVDRFVDVVVASMSLNHLDTADPPPLARIALRGYLAFFEAVLDDARATGTAPEAVLPLLSRTLVTALDGVAPER
jgi:AcrR family transcriptional regulator